MSSRHWKKSAPILSILLTKTMRGTLYLSAWRQTVSVCGSTPWFEVEHAHGAVEHAQRTLDFDGEVDVAGRVDDVEALAVPEGGRRGRRDRDAALLLLLHPVHGRGAVVHFADLVGLAGVIEDPLGRRRLAGIDVGHDAEVAVVLDRVMCAASIGISFLPLPAVVREGAVGFRHPVRVFALLDGVAAVVGGIEQLARQPLDHGLLVAAARGRDAASGSPSAWRRSGRTSTGT